MSERIDIDRLARECGGTHKLSLGVYQFYKDELTAYTRAVMEECARICNQESAKAAEWNDIDGYSEGEMYADAIRREMP